MRPLALWLAVVVGCSDNVPPAAVGAGPVAASASLTARAPHAAPASDPPSDLWRRRPGTEPDPEARALYRRGLQLIHAGKLPEAEALFLKVSTTWPQSRFGARLRTVGASERLLAQAAAGAVGLVALLVYSGLIDFSAKP